MLVPLIPVNTRFVVSRLWKLKIKFGNPRWEGEALRFSEQAPPNPVYLRRRVLAKASTSGAIANPNQGVGKWDEWFGKDLKMRETHEENGITPVVWVGSSHEDLKEFPDDVQDEIGYALYVAQMGDQHPKAKTLKGFSGVWEIRSNYRTDTYRAVYTTKIGDAIYVLHCFQKKSKRGIATPRKEINLIKHRLKIAQDLAKGR